MASQEPSAKRAFAKTAVDAMIPWCLPRYCQALSWAGAVLLAGWLLGLSSCQSQSSPQGVDSPEVDSPEVDSPDPGSSVLDLLGVGSPDLDSPAPDLSALDSPDAVEAVLRPISDETYSTEDIDLSADIIRRRVEGLGVAVSEVTQQGNDIVIRLPDMADQERVVELVGKTAELTFRPVILSPSVWFSERNKGVAENAEQTCNLTEEEAAAATLLPKNQLNQRLEQPRKRLPKKISHSKSASKWTSIA